MLLGLAAAAVVVAVAGCAPAEAPRELWFYYATNLADPEAVFELERVWRRAAAAGYSRVALADPKFSRLGEMDDVYFDNVARVRRLAEEVGLEIVPGVFPIGRSNSLLAHDPHLAEGVPVRDARFVVREGIARIEPDPPVGFGPRPTTKDWNVRLADGVARVRDNAVRARFMYRVAVHPFRGYHVSVRVRTREFTGNPLVQVLAGGKAIHFIRTLGVRPSQDWTTHDIAFNSLDHSEVEIYFGVWDPARGELEWRDWRIEETGPFNVLRRPGAPCVVEGFGEGGDVELVRDDRLGVVPWRGRYEAWHEPPPVRTRLPDGTRLRISWHQPAVLYNGQVMCCISEPAVDSLLADEARRVKAAWGASRHLMMHDEIRVLNWDESCRRRGLSPGAILADHARRCVELLRGSTVYVWNDMFDPHHNAVPAYHLVNGDLAGSWEGLDPDVVIVNWNAGKKEESLKFFAARGHRQVIAGYFDGEPRQVRAWLRAASRVEGVVGVMYTTWRHAYEDLEAFARSCGGGRRPRAADPGGPASRDGKGPRPAARPARSRARRRRDARAATGHRAHCDDERPVRSESARRP